MSKKYFLLISAVFSVFISAQIASANAITYQEFMSTKNFEKSLDNALDKGMKNQEVVSDASEVNVTEDKLMYPYPSSSIYVSTSIVTQVVPDEVYVDGSYYIYGYASQAAAKEELESKYDAVKEAVDDYGTVTLNYMNTYPQSYYPMPYMEGSTEDDSSETEVQYSGDFSFRVALTNMSNLNKVSDIISENGMTSWKSAYVSEEKILNTELAMVEEIKAMIAKKTDLYEKLLDKDLTDIISLDIYAWTGSTFNMEKGTVDLTINANVSYML